MAKILDIVTAPAEVLRVATSDVELSDFPSLVELAADMAETMEAARGIGLAAVQVNRAVRLATIHREASGTSSHLALVNPRVTWKSWRSATDEEGCLSIPGVYGNVRRPASVEVHYRDLDGTELRLKARGLLARVIQHEIDHLDGVLFVDRAESIREGEELLRTWHRAP